MSGWVKRVKHHECRTPSSSRIGVGSLWRCKCGVLWRCSQNRAQGAHRLIAWCVQQEEPADGR
jgi:hypothetical protein